MNLVDRRIIDNQGTTEITGNGTYVAADWGTTFRNTGTFDFKADGDYVEGSVHGHAASLKGPLHQHRPAARRPAASGTSVLDARYSRTEGAAGPGTVRVQSGTLSILSDGTTATVVPGGSGATFATGGCPPLAACAQPATDAGNPQFATLTLPGGTADSAVTITEAGRRRLEGTADRADRAERVGDGGEPDDPAHRGRRLPSCSRPTRTSPCSCSTTASRYPTARAPRRRSASTGPRARRSPATS